MPTAQTAIVGRLSRGPLHPPIEVRSDQFDALFGCGRTGDWPAEIQARQFYAHGGSRLHVLQIEPGGSLESALTGDPMPMTGLGAVPMAQDVQPLMVPE